MEQMRSRNVPQHNVQYRQVPGSFGAGNKQAGGVIDDLDMSEEFISYLNGSTPEFTQDQVDGEANPAKIVFLHFMLDLIFDLCCKTTIV